MKNRPVAGGFAPRPPSTLSLNYSTLLYSNTSPNLDILTIGLSPSPSEEFLVMYQHQAKASDLPFYDIFAPTKNSSFEVSADVIACDL